MSVDFKLIEGFKNQEIETIIEAVESAIEKCSDSEYSKVLNNTLRMLKDISTAASSKIQ